MEIKEWNKFRILHCFTAIMKYNLPASTYLSVDNQLIINSNERLQTTSASDKTNQRQKA